MKHSITIIIFIFCICFNLKAQAKKDIDFIIANYSKYFQIQKEILFLNDVKKQLSLEPNFEFSKTIESLDKFDKVRNNSWRESLAN